MRSNRLLAAAAASILALAGCDKARPLAAPAGPSRGCTSCHGGQDNQTGAPPWSLPRNGAGDIISSGNRFDNTATLTRVEVGAHTRHISRGVSCGACHVVPATIQAPNHNTGRRATVTFKEVAAAGNTPVSSWNTDPNPALPHTCTNYCHGSAPGWTAGGTPGHAPDWLTPGSGACGTCHGQAAGNPLPPASSGHPQVVEATGLAILVTNCINCHRDTVNADGTINLASGKHVNGRNDGGGHPAGWADPNAHGPAANGGLANCTSCHGTDFAGGFSGVSCNACHASNGHPNWQTECTFCHGSATRTADLTFPDVGTGTVVRANLAAPPLGSQGETNSTAYAVGAHQAHTTAGTFARASQCSECHGPTLPGGTAHVGGTVLLGWGVTAGNGITPTPPAGETNRWNDTTLPLNGANCTNFCHGATLAGGTRATTLPVKWNEGAAGATCGSCHAIPLPYTAAGKWHVQRNDLDCSACHSGYTKTTVNVADHIFVGAGPSGLTCTSCHGGAANPAPSPATDGSTSGVKVGAHQQHLATTLTATALGCGECHPSVTSTLHANGVVGMAWILGASTWPSAVFPAPAPAAGSLTTGWETAPNCTNYCHGGFTNGKAATISWTSTTAMTCNSCHGAAGSSANPATLPGGTHPQSNPDCSACHPGYTNTTVNAALHLNGQLDGGESGGGLACSGCHGSIVTQMTTAASKHSLVGWTDTPADSGEAWGVATVLSSILPANRSCVNMCHSDHPHTLTTPATATHQFNLVLDPSSKASRAAGTSTSATRAATDFDPVANTGMCTRCHSKPIVTGGITVLDATFGASAHDFTTSTSPAITWSFALHDSSLFLRNCTKCHASPTEGTTPATSGSGLTAVHGQANPNLLAGTSRPNGVAAGFVCYNCHGSTAAPVNGAQGNRSNKDIQSQIAKARNHPANADNVHDTATELANATFGNTLGVTGRHSSCMDCHDTHEARAGTHAQGTNLAGPPLQGAWGVKFGGTLAAFAAPTAANFTTVPSMVAGTDLEATLCFKCHSSYYGTRPTSPSGGYAETDQAREFNPANPSFHPVLASNSGTIGNTGNITAPWTRTSLMTCTDCHESNLTTDPNGPHGSTAAFILKGPNTTWSSAVIYTTAGMPAGTFCANCHAANFAGSRFPDHTNPNGFHNVACTACHVLIPHGAGHVGMLVSVSTGGTPAGGVQVTDSAPYAVGVRLGIFSYPTAAANWGNSNCGCDSVSNGH